jgi:hypothetical protein
VDVTGPDKQPGRKLRAKGTDMNANITRRIVTALTGPAIAAGILAGGLALGAPAQAQATMGTATCVTAPVLGTSPNMLNPLTRAAQVATYDSITQPKVAAVSCLGH